MTKCTHTHVSLVVVNAFAEWETGKVVCQLCGKVIIEETEC